MGRVLQRLADPVYLSAWAFVALWAVGTARLLAGRPTPAVMAVGVAVLIAHIGLALDRLGGHAAAVEHTARTAGVGWGVYVNYLFAAVWLADTLWLTASVRSYARRPRWVGYAVHGFLAFVVFNATVVYGEWPTQLAGVGWFAVLGYSWWRRSWIAARRASEGRGLPG